VLGKGGGGREILLEDKIILSRAHHGSFLAEDKEATRVRSSGHAHVDDPWHPICIWQDGT
jgi:hypothetical protein